MVHMYRNEKAFFSYRDSIRIAWGNEGWIASWDQKNYTQLSNMVFVPFST